MSASVQGGNLSAATRLHFSFMASTTLAGQMLNATGRNAKQTHHSLEEMFRPTKQYCCLSRNPTQSNRSALYRDLQEYGRFTGLCWLMSPEPATVSKLPIPTIEDIIYSEEFLKTQGSQQQTDCLVRQAKIPDEYILKISDITIGQRNNPTWHLTRRGRLTASNFGCVLKAKRVTQSLLKHLLGEYDLSGVKAVQWGVNNEQEALKAFTALTGKTVQETGIWLNASGILGASPDGIVDHETILEAKCPYTERNLTIEEAIATSPTFCLEKAQDGNGYVLKNDHVYWDQVHLRVWLLSK